MRAQDLIWMKGVASAREVSALENKWGVLLSCFKIIITIAHHLESNRQRAGKHCSRLYAQ